MKASPLDWTPLNWKPLRDGAFECKLPDGGNLAFDQKDQSLCYVTPGCSVFPVPPMPVGEKPSLALLQLGLDQRAIEFAYAYCNQQLGHEFLKRIRAGEAIAKISATLEHPILEAMLALTRAFPDLARLPDDPAGPKS